MIYFLKLTLPQYYFSHSFLQQGLPGNPKIHADSRNIIIHGLKPKDDDSLMEPILDLFQAMGAIIFSSDIEDIVTLGRADPTTLRPPPVRVTFDQFHMRDKVMKKKGWLDE